MKIGITERGDPSIDFTWVDKIADMDGTVIITKNLTDKVIDMAKPFLDKIVFHVSCTGYGGTKIEPNIPNYKTQINNAIKLLELGVPAERVVIRVDPIIPTPKGLQKAKNVIEYAYKMNFRRFRVSLMDAYPHVRERFKETFGTDAPYGDLFSAPKPMVDAANALFRNMKETYKDISIESCAENTLVETERIGCISEKDLALLGLDVSTADSVGYQRKGCLCCSSKRELLSEKKQCPYKCLYCYWKN